jgi:hypothetical protein
MADISNRGINNLKQLFKRVSYLEQKLAATQINTNSAAAHYLVKAPSGGIPPIDGVTPGYALCEMVRRFSEGAQTAKDLADMATVQPVYNLGAAVQPDDIVVVNRDAFGDLFVYRPVVRLAQAPVGGVPARTGITPGSALCTQVIIAPASGSGFSAGDLVKTAVTFTVINWDLIAHGEDGDRIIQVSEHSDNAQLVGSSCTNEEDPAGILLYEPT